MFLRHHQRSAVHAETGLRLGAGTPGTHRRQPDLPEQLRSVSLRRALAQREVGTWVPDETRCLCGKGKEKILCLMK